MALRLAGEGYVEGITDHGQLDGLGDDDHALYLLANGTREAAKLIVTDGQGHYLQVPKLTTAQRDALSPENGMIIYNTTTGQFERYQAGGWGAFGASGATTFLGLTDTPGSYAGQAGKVASVKGSEDGLEFSSAGAGDMLKSVYDTDDDGVVDNSEKLEGSTKAQVQDHDPKAHTHVEADITDLDHDAVKLQGRDLDSAAPADGQVVTWEQATSKWKPKTPAGGGDMLKSVYDTDDDGIVDNSEKLEGSTKAQVQDHNPKAHAASHQDAGADEITSALDPRAYPMLADVVANRPAAGVAGRFFWATDEGILYRDNGTSWDKVAVSDYPDLDDIPSSFTPSAHKASHEDAGADEISVAGLSGELADLQKVKDHAHQSSGGGAGGKLDHGLALEGLGDDDHPQYLNTARHDTTERHPLGTVVPHDALANLTERNHSSLTGIGPSDHHQKTIDASELTQGHLPAPRLGGILTTQGDIMIRDATGPTRLGAGTSGQFLKTQGAGQNPVWADVDGGSFDFFEKYREFLPWPSLDGFVTTVDTGGSVEAKGWYVKAQTGSTSGNRAFVRSKARFECAMTSSGKVFTVEFCQIDFPSSNHTTFLFMTDSTDAPPSETSRHLGFKIVNADVYASNGDGTNQTITDTGQDVVTGAKRFTWKAVWTDGVNIKFYYNNVLKVTHTENLPAYWYGYYVNVGITTNAGVAKYIEIARVAVERSI